MSEPKWFVKHTACDAVAAGPDAREVIERLLARDDLDKLCRRCDRYLDPPEITIQQLGTWKRVTYAELEEGWKSRPEGWPPEDDEDLEESAA